MSFLHEFLHYELHFQVGNFYGILNCNKEHWVVMPLLDYTYYYDKYIRKYYIFYMKYLNIFLIKCQFKITFFNLRMAWWVYVIRLHQINYWMAKQNWFSIFCHIFVGKARCHNWSIVVVLYKNRFAISYILFRPSPFNRNSFIACTQHFPF